MPATGPVPPVRGSTTPDLSGLLIDGQGATGDEFFDIGYSRSLPWRRRPEAARLLEAAAAPDRTFDAVVIGEPQRAFYGSQFSDTFPGLQHFGVDLWVPDPGVVSTWINEAQAVLARARTVLALLNNEVPGALSRTDLTTVLGDMSLLVSGLSAATPVTKADLYRDLGVRLTDHHDSGQVDAEVSTAVACAKRGVRGATRYIRTRLLLLGR